jgi:hypothetical protein
MEEGDVSFVPVPAAASAAAEAAATLRPALALGAAQTAPWADLALAAERDACAAWFCAPLPPPVPPPVPNEAGGGSSGEISVAAGATAAAPAPLGALLLGFPTARDIAEGDLKALLLTAQAVGRRHGAALARLAATVAPVLAPRQERPGWGLAGGLLRASDLGEEGGDASGDDDASAREPRPLTPAEYELFSTAGRWTLAFRAPRAEGAFAAWRAAAQARLDGAALAALAAHQAAGALALARSRGAPAAAAAWALLPAAAALAALAALAAPATRAAAARHRDVLLLALFAVLALTSRRAALLALEGAPAAGASARDAVAQARARIAARLPAAWAPWAPTLLGAPDAAGAPPAALVAAAQCGWALALAAALQVRFRWQVPALVATAAAAAAGAGAATGAAAIARACAAAALPAAALYALERAARREFCASAAAAPWVRE